MNTALLARIETLEAENTKLKSQSKKRPFRIEDIKHDDRLFRFYTGFVSYAVFLTFFQFLGPVVDHLNYWGSKDGIHTRKRSRKLDTQNQLFLTLVKLKLNLKITDLAFRFGSSKSQISRYLITWICFLFHHLKKSTGCQLYIKCQEHYQLHFVISFLLHMPSLMLVRYSLRRLQICICSLQLGVTTSTTILLSFWLPVLPMERYVTYRLCI